MLQCFFVTELDLVDVTVNHVGNALFVGYTTNFNIVCLNHYLFALSFYTIRHIIHTYRKRSNAVIAIR